jgi:hypothetical protein
MLPEPTAGRRVLRRCGGTQCPPGTCDHDDTLRRSATGHGPVAAPSVVHRVLDTPGEDLDRAARGHLEPRFGHDFSSVRVHTDGQAAASADAVSARAYTVGNHIAFAAGAYRPATDEGRRLIAHELAHTVQQGPTVARTAAAELVVGDSDDPAEHRADAIADRVMAGAASSSSPPATTGPTLRRQGGGGGGAGTRDPVADARAAAFIRVFIVYQRLAGLGPPPPPGLESAARVTEATTALELRNLARRMFDWDNPNMDQITEIVGQMRDRLGPQLQTVRAPQNDPDCGNRAAYVVGGRPPVHLCPAFFSSTPEQRIRTMIHEAAHLARIGQASLGESYCVDFDCTTDCGGFESADSWAHFVHCAGGQRPDQPTVIRGGRPRGGKP